MQITLLTIIVSLINTLSRGCINFSENNFQLNHLVSEQQESLNVEIEDNGEYNSMEVAEDLIRRSLTGWNFTE